MVKLMTPLAVAALFTSVPAYADDPYPGPIISLGGFVDMSIMTGLDDATRANGVILGVDQVELDVDVLATEHIGLRLDLELFPQSPVERADDLVEQAYAHLAWDGPFVRAGKWNAPMGLEGLDPAVPAFDTRGTALYQFSYGLLRTYALPANLTGIALGWRAKRFSAEVWLSNDWDTPSTPKDASIGTRFAYEEGPMKLGISGMIGPLAPRPGGARRLVLDLELAIEKGPLVLGAEANFGAWILDEADPDVDVQRSVGALVMANYTFTDHFNLTARVDWIDRDMPDADVAQASATLAANFPFEHHFNVVTELRFDFFREAPTTAFGAVELTAYF